MNLTFRSNPVTLAGPVLTVGSKIPEFTLTDGEMNPFTASAVTGPAFLLTVPSLDTGVCDQEVRRFNEAAAKLPGVTVYAVSMDLPFAQNRWCAGAGIQNVKTLSDYKDHSFGKATGTRLEELGLLTRAVFVLDAGGQVVYTEYVPEVTDHPNYDAALACLAKI